ncbi:hypothetical protein NNJEOMEG_00977 [Fundidesulfovibrio magnetotacticus]|uniref:Uncharacterized protein n=1 Tax=Fundidesulfovibrio magnetotacticus TaxID=2730080 RepID=A0A6V8LTL3_9BACT|nr:hypothetical protein [Fundidesulfovibrio magnetotacticus]GFK93146.1 hypothetical protein NNJEOMEG_00977 [Fundidesulfovibrio magnetotacticus]
MPTEKMPLPTGALDISAQDVETDIRRSLRIFRLTLKNNCEKPVLVYRIQHGHSKKATVIDNKRDAFYLAAQDKQKRLLAYVASTSKLLFKHIDYINKTSNNSIIFDTPICFRKIETLFRKDCLPDICITGYDSALTIYKLLAEEVAACDKVKCLTPSMTVLAKAIEELGETEKYIARQMKPIFRIDPGKEHTQAIHVLFRRNPFESRQELLGVTCLYVEDTLGDSPRPDAPAPEEPATEAAGQQETPSPPSPKTDPADPAPDTCREEPLDDEMRVKKLKKFAAKRVYCETGAIISPVPLVLSLMAVLFSAAGLFIKEKSFVALREVLQSCAALLSANTVELTTNATMLLTSMLLAFIVFNVYEYTSFKDKITMGLNWRSALILGTLCGLAGDKFQNALRALIP